MKETLCNTCGRVYKTQKDYLTKTSRIRICTQKNLWFDCSCRSSLMLLEGDYEWYTPLSGMRPKAATIFQSVKELGQIPLISNQTMRIINVASNPKSEVKDIETELKKVPPLVLETLKIANNLKLSDGQTISSIPHAINYMGRQALADLILAASMKGFVFKTKVFAYDLFWHESAVAGHVAEFLTRELAPHLDPDQAYLASSLTDVGKIVQAVCLPQQADHIFTQTQNPKAPITWSKAEERTNSYSHCTLGEIAGTIWGFPNYMMPCIMGHHTEATLVKEECSGSIFFFDEEPAKPETAKNSVEIHDIVALAEFYKHWVLLQPSRVDETIFNSYLAKCKLSEGDGYKIGKKVSDHLKKIL
jgi:HD-like signal output (HDOD) protein